MNRLCRNRVFVLALKSILSLVFMLISADAYSQFYSLGEERIGQRWNYLKTPHYKVIFPFGTDSLAMRYAYLLEANRGRVIDSTGAAPVRYPVILHTENAMSNGSVALTPHRMELFTIPSPDAYSELWDHQLVVHESRHVAQMDAFYGGLFKYLYWFLGEQSPGLAASLLGNRMLFEGDAVISETQFSHAGRGRDSEFLRFFRTAYIKGDERNFHRWFFGSNKYYTPNRYATGYVFCTGARLYSDNGNVMQDIFKNFVRNWYYIFLYDVETYRKKVGINNHNILKYGQFTMSQIWKKEYAEAGVFSAYDSLPIQKKKLYTDYKEVIPRDSSYLSMKKGMEHVNQLVKIENGRESFVRHMSSTVVKLSSVGDTLYWTENVPHPRWPNKCYSDVFTFDLESGRRKRLTRRKYYYYPYFDGERVYVSEYHPRGTTSIVCLDSRTGKETGHSRDFSGIQFKEIVSSGDSLYFTAISKDGIGLYRALKDDVSGLSLKDTVLAPVPARLQGLRVSDDVLYFESDRTTVSEIYALKDGEVRKLTNSEFGASDPYVQDSVLIYSNYDIDGDSPVRVPLKDCLWEKVDFSRMSRYEVAEQLTDQVRHMKPADVDTSGFEVKRYSRFLNMFNFHSWTPFYYDLDAISNLSFDAHRNLASLGLTFQAQNHLNTSQMTLGYSYYKGFHAGHLKWKYSGLFPVFEISLDVNDRNSMSQLLVDTPDRVRSSVNHGVPFVNLHVNAYVPLNFSSGGWSRGLIPQFSYLFTNDRYYSHVFHGGAAPLDEPSAQLGVEPMEGKGFKTRYADVYRLTDYEYDYASRLLAGVRYYQVIPTSKSAIFPRWGFSISAYWTQVPGKTGLFGNLAYLYAYGYVPGFTRQQGLKMTFVTQAQFLEGATYYQGNLFSLPRGYRNFASGMYMGGTLDYAIPIYLGDTPLGWFAYLKRLQLIPFVDAGANYMDVRDFGKPVLPGRLTDRLKFSAGTDVLLDATFLGINLPISIGFRYAYTLEDPVNFQFLFSVGLD